MKWLGSGILLVALAVLPWQWRTLANRRQVESQLQTERAKLEASQSPILPEDARAEAIARPDLDDAALPALTSDLRGMEEKCGAMKAGMDAVKRTYLKNSALMDAMVRLSPSQAVAIFEEWKARDKGAPTGLKAGYFVRMLGELNPAAAVEMIARSGNIEWLDFELSQAFRNWFRKDPEEMRRWFAEWSKGRVAIKPGERFKDRATAMEAVFTDTILTKGVLWNMALDVLRDPGGVAGGELARRVPASLSNPMPQTAVLVTALQELGAKLETNESRLKFLRVAHAATNGKGNMVPFIATAIQKSTFRQAALLVEMAPHFEPFSGERELSGKAIPPVSLHLMAAQSQDATPAERWAWLASHEQPTGDALKRLVKNWVRNDDAATKEWITSLPPGQTHDLAEAEYREWAASNISKSNRGQ